MSRNLRKKATKAVAGRKAKTPSRRTSPSTSDDDYAGLEEISESDDEEPDVEAAEEQAIIESMARGSDDEEDADDESDDADDAPQPDMSGEDDDDDDASFNGFPDEPANEFFNDQMVPTARRRVRFDLADEEVDYSSASDSDSDGSVFPDLLAEEDMDPKFRQLVQNEDEDDDDSSETFWDWENATANYDYIDNGENGIAISDDDSESSGYSTDEGETTEEDMPIGPNISMAPSRMILNREDEDSSSEEEIVSAQTPKLGTWYNDGTESFALTDHSSQKLMVFVAKTPQKRRHSFDATPSAQLTAQSSFSAAEPFSDMSQSQMMMATPENVMLGANWIDSSNNGFIMSPEALTGSAPYTYNGSFSQFITGSQSPSTEGDLDEIAIGDFDINDFVHRSSDEEDEEDSSVTGVESSPSHTRRSSTARSMGSQAEHYIHPLLSHLEAAGVGAFRRNQNHHRLITRNNESYESLAFSSPLHEGTLRGVKQGKLAAVNAPITPMRKAKTKVDFHVSPTQDAAKRKREFSGEQSQQHGGIRGHKRTRSMA